MISTKNTLMTLGVAVLISGSCLMMMFSGCANLPMMPGRVTPAEEAKVFREEFQSTRSRKAMLWLLTNRVEQGMSQKTVNEALGQEGERITADKQFKEGSGAFRRGDKTYRYGPDAEGRSIFLMFREDKLVNYDAEDFE